MTANTKPTRLSLGRSPKRFSFERLVLVWVAAFSLPSLLFAGLYVQLRFGSGLLTGGVAAVLAAAWVYAWSRFNRLFTRPMNTLTNVVASLRLDDFSLRARGARRGDALGDLALEVNLLAGTLQRQRTAVLDALALVEQVLSAMPSPVLAFDRLGHLRLSNQAADAIFSIGAEDIGSTASALNLLALLEVADQGVLTMPSAARWSVRRTAFRLQGVPHTLFVLADVAAALREEERVAWQRLVRVLSHEINNSLAPIQSIAGSLRTRVQRQPAGEPDAQLLRGLAVIEDRSAALHRFLQNYQQISRLPVPSMRRVDFAGLLERVAAVETRVKLVLETGPSLTATCDPDQVEQALINLLRNAADAALEDTGEEPEVHVGCSATATSLVVEIVDNGLGLADTLNLFVPFYTTKPLGSGVGLVLARQIAGAHGGTVTLADRQDGRGCVATFSIPLSLMGTGGRP